MAYRYTGLGEMSTPLKIVANAPLDTRTVVNNTSDLYQVPTDQAYRGMTISNLEDGNIYMLIDENKITKQEGWKSSQSALQIISCTQEEYDEWAKNTNNNYAPINPDLPYISQGVYYYIYEDEQFGVYYLTSEWGKDVENQLKTKASDSALKDLIRRVEVGETNLSTNYLTSEVIINTYATQAILNEMFDLENPTSYISQIVAKHYTKEESDAKYVTKESLGGDLSDLGDGENLVFVPSTQYAADKEALRQELDQTLKLNGEGSLENITVGQIKSPITEEGEQLVVDVTKDGLFINNDRLAGKSEIPIIKPISKTDYDEAVKNGTINEEAYYYVYNTDEDLVYITNKDLIASYHTTGQYQSWVAGYAYSKEAIDKIVATLQGKDDYVLLNQLNDYYTKTQADQLFLTQTDAQNTYATNSALTTLEQEVANNYVSKSDLRPDPENPESDDDFIFVTQKVYSDDKETMAKSFTTEALITDKITLAEDNDLAYSEGRLVHNNEPLALVKDVHKVEIMTETEYQELVAQKKTKENTYYYTYEPTNSAPTGYVQLDYIESTYYNKKTIDEFLGIMDSNNSQNMSSELDKIRQSITDLSTDTENKITNIVNVLLTDLENRLQAQIDNMQIRSEVSEHGLSISDNDIVMVEGKTLHIISPSKVSVNGLQIVVN